MAEERKLPKVGIAAIVIRDGKVLVHQRKGSHGGGMWAFPGGHLEWHENPGECAIRETMEEAGIVVKNPRFATLTNDIQTSPENIHYITLYYFTDYVSGEAKVMEPDRCFEWRWAEWNNLPRPLFLPLENLIKMKFNPFKK